MSRTKTHNFISFFRHLYRIKVVYPPVEYATLEPTECLTCPLYFENEGGYDVSIQGQSPQCLWTDVEMSKNAERYILYCK